MHACICNKPSPLAAIQLMNLHSQIFVEHEISRIRKPCTDRTIVAISQNILYNFNEKITLQHARREF
jgi:hypothetical protein